MSKPTIKDMQAELHSLRARHLVTQGSNDRLLKELKRLKGSPKVQEQLNMANAKVAELMNEVETLKSEKQRVVDEYHLLVKQSEELPLKLQAEINRLTGETYYNKGDKEIIIRDLTTENEKLKSDYAELDEKYYTQMDCYTELNKEYKDLLDRFTKISAENHALKAEIERTNRHINLAENQLHKEQQPLVVNHYHNCTINKGL